MEQRETDWRTILLLVGAAGGAVMAYALAVLIAVFAGLDALQPSPATPGGRSSFDFFVLAAAPLVIGTMFLPAIYYSIRRLMSRPFGAGPVPTGIPNRPHGLRLGKLSLSGPVAMSLLYGLAAALIWLGVAFLAGSLASNPVLKWFTPPLYVLAILIPAVFFVWISIRGLNPGSAQRRWGVLAAGIGLGIAPAMMAELMLLFAVLLVLVIYVAFNPAQLATFEELARQLERTSDINQVLSTAGPLLASPVVLVLALVFFSGFSPLIEEIAKSLAVWTVFDRLASPAQGFAIGAISGAAFGLVESLLVSAQPDSSWTSTLLVRGASTMMHIMSASFTGWGIGRFRARRRFVPLLGMYLMAMALHGLWNGSVVLITVGTVRTTIAASGRDVAGALLVYLGVAVLAALCLAIPVAMWTINGRLRAASANADISATQPARSVPPVTPEDGQNREEAPPPLSPSG